MKVVDLFAGCGGLSLGFIKAGFNIVAAFDCWEPAISCYKENFSHPIYNLDLSDVDKACEQIKNLGADIVIGGPPCQDFSHAGKRVEGKRANLTKCFANIIAAILPHFFVMENVDRIRNSASYANAREIFKSASYGLNEITLDASLCGTPQKRKRFLCFGVLGGKDDDALHYITKNIAQNRMTIRDYFGNSLGFEYYYRHPRNYSRRAIFSIDEPAPTIRGVNRPVPKGYPGHPGDSCPVSVDLHVLTTRERALFQTFPETFKFSGTKTNIEQMIGNAVPVNFAKFIANCIKPVIKG